VSGNAVTLLTSAFLFALISSVQYFFAVIANSNALKVLLYFTSTSTLLPVPHFDSLPKIGLVASNMNHFAVP
jgi:hypothetical protein